MAKQTQNQKQNISSFVIKLLKLLEDPRYKNIISWSPDGGAITIDSHNEQLETTLSKYFNHTKISSFVRQLNLYGFKKVSQRDSEMMYKHQFFIRDKQNLHMLIKRKRKNRIHIQNLEEVQHKRQNSILERQKDKIKGLQDIYCRIKAQNQKIINQTNQIYSLIQTLTHIRKSPFFTQLKQDSTETWSRTDQNSLQPTQNKSSSNDQQQTLQSQNHTQYQNGCRNDFDMEGENNNEVKMFEEDIEELSCEKMGMENQEEASFWRKDHMECGDLK